MDVIPPYVIENISTTTLHRKKTFVLKYALRNALSDDVIRKVKNITSIPYDIHPILTLYRFPAAGNGVGSDITGIPHISLWN